MQTNDHRMLRNIGEYTFCRDSPLEMNLALFANIGHEHARRYCRLEGPFSFVAIYVPFCLI